MGPGERVCLVEHQEVETRVREEFDITLSGEQQLQLLGVREQDARLAAGPPHHLARADLLGGMHRLASHLAPHLGEPRLAVRA